MKNKIEFKLTLSAEDDCIVDIETNATYTDILAAALTSADTFADAGSKEDAKKKRQFLMKLKDAISQLMIKSVLNN